MPPETQAPHAARIARDLESAYPVTIEEIETGRAFTYERERMPDETAPTAQS